MPLKTQPDPFKPQDPKIPGVPEAAKKPKETAAPAAPSQMPVSAAFPTPASTSKNSKSQIVALIIGLAGLIIVAGCTLLWKSHIIAATPADLPASVPVATSADVPAPVDALPNEPTAPGVVATAAELAKPWASKNFIFRNGATEQSIPALVIHLPRGGYWGVSMVEPYGSCRLEYVTDLQKLAKVYDFKADHPMIGDPCSHSVFDLATYGGPANAEVRGEIVHGSALRPPLAIEIQERGSEIVAVKME